jgi:hypothetical protein
MTGSAWMPASAGMTNYDTVSKGRGEITFDNTKNRQRRRSDEKSNHMGKRPEASHIPCSRRK